jgi:hypothetical protein
MGWSAASHAASARYLIYVIVLPRPSWDIFCSEISVYRYNRVSSFPDLWE